MRTGLGLGTLGVLLPIALLPLAAVGQQRGTLVPQGGHAVQESAGPAGEGERIGGGELRIIQPDGSLAASCPLKHTDVTADIAGFFGRTTVKQVFYNPTDRKIEAIYVFPLPQDAAVDDMVMLVGDRRVVGQIHEREEARQIYEAAKAAGHVAGLLDQERPNIFKQSVANIEPGVEVTIEIRYVETLKYEDGVYEWVFPMVVGPRYIPGGGSAPSPMTNGRPTPQVPDAGRITPPVTPEGTRAGHDISLTVNLDGGLPVSDVACTLHEIDVKRLDAEGSRVQVALRNQAEIPNRDFILHYKLAAEGIGDAFLIHQDERGQFFTLILQPPPRVAPPQLVARELVFVLDTSGSMHGFPIDKSKEVMNKLIETMRPGDTFNVITFSGDTRVLWESPKPATNENIAAAQKFLNAHEGSGGTEMMKAIDAALVQTGEGHANAIRVVCFMTDGYVGNDMEIIAAVKKNAGTTRVFSFGTGNSVNRFLLDGMAAAGRGEVEYVTLASEADAAVARFHERILAPVLTDVALDWGALPVSEVYPAFVPDLFSSKPIIVHGRLNGPAAGTLRLSGRTGSGPYAIEVDVTPPAEKADHPALATLWARAKVADLMQQDYEALQRGEFPEELKKQIIELGLTYRLMTQFTSFVAVEELTVTSGGEAVKVQVPVEMPQGVSYEGVFGGQGDKLGMGMFQQGGVAVGGVGGKAPAARGMPIRAGGRGRAAAPPVMEDPGVARGRMRVTEADRDGVAGWREAETLKPEEKLAESLRDLAANVARDGKDGSLTVGKMKVADYRVDVMIFLVDASAETLKKLAELGFKSAAESKTTSVVMGSIDVRKLEELVKLEEVMSVRPLIAP